MATTYQTSKVASTVQARAGIDLTCSYATYEATVQIVINDVFEMVKMAAGQTVVEVIGAFDDNDGGSAAVAEIGDGSDTDRFASTTISQGGGVIRLGQGITGAAAADCLAYTYTAADTIDIKFTTAPASTGTGTITLVVFHTGNS